MGKDIVSCSTLNIEESGRSTKKGDNKKDKESRIQETEAEVNLVVDMRVVGHVVRKGTSSGTARHRKINRMRIVKEVKTLLILLTSLIIMP